MPQTIVGLCINQDQASIKCDRDKEMGTSLLNEMKRIGPKLCNNQAKAE